MAAFVLSACLAQSADEPKGVATEAVSACTVSAAERACATPTGSGTQQYTADATGITFSYSIGNGGTSVSTYALQ